MPLIEHSEHLPLYTLIQENRQTKQKSICTYGVHGAILTSNVQELIIYATTLAFHNIDCNYIISRCEPIHVFE